MVSTEICSGAKLATGGRNYPAGVRVGAEKFLFLIESAAVQKKEMLAGGRVH